MDSTGEVAAFLQQSAEDAVVAPRLIEQIGDWVREQRAAAAGEPQGCVVDDGDLVEQAELEYRDSFVTEQFVTLGAARMVGVLTTPLERAAADDGVFVLVSSGSDPHIGPGRAWVELARHLASEGVSTLRVDFRGWGESPDGPTSQPGRPGRPYDAHGEDDVVDLVDALREQGKRVVLGGLCARAWIALAAARHVELAGSVLLNPQLYWRPGYPVIALIKDARAYMKPEFDYNRAEALTGRWDREDEQGLRPPAGVWLDELAARAQPVTMIFASDDGIDFLRTRLGRRTADALDAGWLTIEETHVDHSMHETWLRPIVFDLVSRHVHRILHRGSNAQV